jgi:hypothetical protein
VAVFLIRKAESGWMQGESWIRIRQPVGLLFGHVAHLKWEGITMQVAFGDAYAFSFIWTMFFVLTNASLAIGAVTFSRYIVAGVSTQYFPPLPTSITLIVVWYEAETFLRMPLFQFLEVQAESVSVPYTKLKMINSNLTQPRK